MCEDCGLKTATYGAPGTKRKRWCAGCARSDHPQAVNIHDKKCEDCGLKLASYGAPGTKRKRKRWCAGCARSGHPQAVDVRSAMCEDCGEKHASYRPPGTKRKRWCAGCARSAHPQAVSGHPQVIKNATRKRKKKTTRNAAVQATFNHTTIETSAAPADASVTVDWNVTLRRTAKHDSVQQLLEAYGLPQEDAATTVAKLDGDKLSSLSSLSSTEAEVLPISLTLDFKKMLHPNLYIESRLPDWMPTKTELERSLADYIGSAQTRHHGAGNESTEISADEIFASVRKMLTGTTKRTRAYSDFLLKKYRGTGERVEVRMEVETQMVSLRALAEERAITHNQHQQQGKMNDATKCGSDRSAAMLYTIKVVDADGREFVDDIHMKVTIDLTAATYDGKVRTQILSAAEWQSLGQQQTAREAELKSKGKTGSIKIKKEKQY